MKKLLLTKVMLLLCALLAGTSNMWASEESVDFSAQEYSNASTITSYDGTNFSVTFDKGTNSSNAPKYYTTGTAIRCYGGNSFTVSSSNSITKIVLTFGSGDGSNAITSDVGNYDAGTWVGNATSVTFTVGGSTGNRRLKEISVTYVVAPAFTINATSNDTDLGTVSLVGNVITATPGEDVRYATPAYSVTSGSATVSQDGDEFTVTPTSNCTVRINFEAIPSHTLSYSVYPVGAGTVTLGATSVLEGRSTTIEAAANEGYKFKRWTVEGTDATLDNENAAATTVTMGTANATVTAEFDAVVTHSISWSVNDVVVKTDNVEENTPINFAAPASGVPAGYVFKGWVTEANKINTPTDTDPSANYVTSGNSTADITYYAVMAVDVVNATNENVTIDTETSGVPASYGSKNAFDDCVLDGKNFKVQQMYLNNGALQWRAGGNTNGTGTIYNADALNKIQSVVLNYDGADSNKNFTLYVGDSENPTSGTSVEPSIDGDVYTFDCSSLNKSYFVLTNGSGAGYLASIVINYLVEEGNTFNYCTTVPTATITLNSDCHDGEGNYYGTYSNASAFVVPAGLTVQTIAVDGDGKLSMSDYAEGDIVKANTGVLVSSTVSDEKTINLAAGGTELAGNMLKASSVEMTGDCKFYRLTMHDGTKLGFWWGAANGASFDIDANKAYLAVPNGTSVRGFSLGDDDATGINSTEATEKAESTEVYNLSGQRVSKPTKGLYIVNGKKVMVK